LCTHGRKKCCCRALAKYLDDPSIFFAISSDFCHWGSRFDYTPYNKELGPIHKYIEALDFEGIEVKALFGLCPPYAHKFLTHLPTQLIQKQDPAQFHAYLKRTKNTICGRHPIAVLLNAIEAAETAFEVKFTRYAQSEAITRADESSVSYASAVITASGG
jgi:AmmeMemoRadiSam system protein B